MIEVELPDGTIVEFPEGTPPDVIKGALQKKFGSPQQPAPEAKSIGGFLANIPKNAYDVGEKIVSGAYAGGRKLVTDPIGAMGDVQNLKTSMNDLAVGGARNAYNMVAPESMQAAQTPESQMASQVGGKLKDRYWDNLGDTVYNEPVQSAMEASSVLYGGQGLLGRALGEGAMATKLTGKAAGLLNPLNAVAKPIQGLRGAGYRALTPFPVAPERQVLLKTLKKEGIDLTAGQATGSNTLRYAESELGGSKGARMMEKQGEQFTSAALKRAGITADRATPEVLDKAFTRIGNEFDNLAARNTMQPDAKLAKDVTDAVQSYVDVTTPTTRFDNVGKLANEILGSPNGMAGPKYQKLRSDIETIARNTKDGTHASALRDLKNALDEAMERTLQANNSPDLGAWRKVRREYRNIIVLEQAATGAGEKAAEGLLSPSALRTATVTKHGRRNYARGTGDFADLARAGEATMKPLPQSGTAPRTAARAMGTSVPTLIGAALGYGAGPMEMIAGAWQALRFPMLLGADSCLSLSANIYQIKNLQILSAFLSRPKGFCSA